MTMIAVTALLMLAAPPSQNRPKTTPPPAQTRQAAPAPAAPLPFPADARIGFIHLDTIFNTSSVGKQGLDALKKLRDKVNADLASRQQAIQALVAKINAQRSVTADNVLAQWNDDLRRMQREAQFAQQEGQAESEELQQRVLADFERQIQPAVEAVRVEHHLWAILAAQGDSGGLSVMAAEPGLDLSAEVVARLDAKK